MSLNPWTVVVGGNLYLGVVCLVWPFMAFMSGFAFDAPADTISASVNLLRQVAVLLIFLYPILFLIALGGSVVAYRAGASVNKLLLWLLPPFLTPPPWIFPVLVVYLVYTLVR